MKKYTNNFLKILNIVLLLLICLMATFFVPLICSDQLWNFQNIFKMYNGFKIYNDSNVIVTPLFFFIECIIFKIFSANFFIFRITNIFIIAIFFLYLYKIQRKLDISKNISVLFLILAFFDTFYLYAGNGANYNTFAILFFTIGINTYFSNRNSNFFQGIILFIIFFIKQTIGLFYLFAIFFYELYKYKFSKKFFINQFEKLLTFFIPFTISLLLLYFNNNLDGFINYAFGGLFDFSKNNFDFSVNAYDLFIIFITYLLSIVVFFMKSYLSKFKLSKNFFENLIILIIFSTCALLLAYPIFNDAHIEMVIPYFFIILSYILSNIFNDFLKKNSSYINILSTLILIVLVITIFIKLIFPYKYIKADFISDYSSPFFGVWLLEDRKETIDTLTNYIKHKNELGIDVIICSSDSAYTMIPLKQSHGAYDLIFYGNLGYNGIEKMKQDILSKENTEFLIHNNKKIYRTRNY